MLLAFMDGVSLRSVDAPSTGQKLRLRSDSGVALSVSNVTSWTDTMSGSGLVVLQPIDANRPTFTASSINGKPALTYDLNKVLYNSSTDPLTSGSDRSVIVIAKAANSGTGTNTGGIFCCFRASSPVWIAQFNNQVGDGNTYVYSNASIAPPVLAAQYNFTAGSPFLYEHYGTVAADQGLSIYVNGVNLPTGAGAVIAETGTTGFQIGNYYGGTLGWIGDIAEIIVYDHRLTAPEIAQLRAYVRSFYGVSV